MSQQALTRHARRKISTSTFSVPRSSRRRRMGGKSRQRRSEHHATAVMYRLIGRLGPLLTRRGRTQGRSCSARSRTTSTGSPRLVADVLRAGGYSVADLGANTPSAIVRGDDHGGEPAPRDRHRRLDADRRRRHQRDNRRDQVIERRAAPARRASDPRRDAHALRLGPTPGRAPPAPRASNGSTPRLVAEPLMPKGCAQQQSARLCGNATRCLTGDITGIAGV